MFALNASSKDISQEFISYFLIFYIDILAANQSDARQLWSCQTN